MFISPLIHTQGIIFEKLTACNENASDINLVWVLVSRGSFRRHCRVGLPLSQNKTNDKMLIKRAAPCPRAVETWNRVASTYFPMIYPREKPRCFDGETRDGARNGGSYRVSFGNALQLIRNFMSGAEDMESFWGSRCNSMKTYTYARCVTMS